MSGHGIRRRRGAGYDRHRRPRLRAEQLARLGEDKVFDLGPARRDLDYRPRGFTEGIRAEAAMLG